MKITLNGYCPNTNISSDTNASSISDGSKNRSFEDVLVLNQNALKAMAIDAMIAESSTGSIDPDAVNAAAVMKFRNTLADHIVSPVPEDNFVLQAPKSSASFAESNFSDTLDEIKGAVSGDFNSGVLTCSEELNTYFQEAASTYGIDVKLLKSIAYAESNFNSDCTSSAGAMGIMQMMPETAKSCGVTDPYDARQNILGGAKFFSNMLNRYNGNVSLALAAYNAGPGNVDKYGGIPPFKETQNYVPKVLNYYNS